MKSRQGVAQKFVHDVPRSVPVSQIIANAVHAFNVAIFDLTFLRLQELHNFFYPINNIRTDVSPFTSSFFFYVAQPLANSKTAPSCKNGKKHDHNQIPMAPGTYHKVV